MSRKTDLSKSVAAEPRVIAVAEQVQELAQAGVGRRTVSMPQDVIAEVDGRVGAREFSGYVTAAVRRQLQRENITEFLAAADELDGPVSEEVRSEVDDALRAALSAAG